MGIWNGDAFRDIRKKLVSGDIAGTDCASCQARLFDEVKKPPLYISSESYIRAVESYENGDIELDYAPISYYYGLEPNCNLDCVMCSQETLRSRSDKFPQRLVDDFFDNECWKSAARLTLVGGEPLLVTTGVNMLKRLGEIADTHNLSHLLLDILTNGTLIHKWIEYFRKFPRVNLAISVDSTTKEVYEHIRKNAKWEQTRDNLLSFQRESLIAGRDWSANLTFVVMRSNLHTLGDTIKWCHEHQFKQLNFVPILGADKLDDNIFVFNYLLDEMPQWRSYFEDATRIAESFGDNRVAKAMVTFKKLLETEPWVSKEMADQLLAGEDKTRNLNSIYIDKVKASMKS